jgi:chromate transporter
MKIARIAEVAGVFLKLGATSYGGPAVIGILQTEIQERRGWLSKERFVEGLALVSMLPGPGVTQLAMVLGYARAGWWGGLLAGLCFVLPAFVIMLGLTLLYAHLGAVPRVRSLFYGLNPVVVGVFGVAVYRLTRVAITDRAQAVLAVAGALVIGLTSVGIVPALLVAGAAGVALYRSRRAGLTAALAILAATAAWHWAAPALQALAAAPSGAAAPAAPSLTELGLFFLKVGAFTFGGGLSILAFMQQQVIEQLRWLTPQQFLDGLALGQLTPGAIIMLAAFVGYQVATLSGAVVAAVAIVLPAFVLQLSVLPLMDPLRRAAWMRAALKGISPVVIGMIAAAIVRMVPSAVTDPLTTALAVVAVGVLLLGRLGPLPLMGGGAVIGLLARAG